MDSIGAMGYWLTELSLKSEGTRRSYLSHFNRFIESQGLTADTLYRMQKEALTSADRRDSKAVVNLVRGYMNQMLKEGKAPGTVRGIVKALRSFFEANELEFSIKEKDQPPRVYDGPNVILRDQIRDLYDKVGAEFRLRNRAVILLLKDTGLRVSDVSPLNVGDFKNAKEVPNEAGERFRIFDAERTKKMGIYAYIHIGPEVVAALDTYIKDREAQEGYLEDDAPLFIQRGGERATAHALAAQLKRLCELLGQDGKKISAHSLRKFHRTMLSVAQVQDPLIWKLEGRATDPYNQVEKTGHLTKAYIAAYDQLRIFGSESKKDRERDQEINGLQTELERVKSGRSSEMEELKKQVKELTEKLDLNLKYRPWDVKPSDVADRIEVIKERGLQGVPIITSEAYKKLTPEERTEISKMVNIKTYTPEEARKIADSEPPATPEEIAKFRKLIEWLKANPES